MIFKLIVAMCNTRGIGLKNKLPWRIKEDLQFFSKMTKGSGNNAIIMGKNTWLSLNSKCLPERDNLILSTSISNDNTCINNLDTYIFNNINSILDHCNKKKYDDVWIIGGSSIYKQFLNTDIISDCYITYIDKEYECDTFFPELDTSWNLIQLDKLYTKENINVFIHHYIKSKYDYSKINEYNNNFNCKIYNHF